MEHFDFAIKLFAFNIALSYLHRILDHLKQYELADWALILVCQAQTALEWFMGARRSIDEKN